jgi:hypothetical protein
VSVDTNTKGKDLNPYEPLAVGDVEILVPANLQRWAANLIVDARRSLLGTRFVVEAGHAHGPT